MTTPEQRTASVLATRDFLKTLAEGKTYEVHGAVRALATGMLLSYPTPTEILLSSLALPEMWGLPEGSPDAS
ncbi:BPSL0761 family protein [Caballeronia sp. S22]|uniref:BPSL0761 family protein n=1 Tax=Caballeronia sp. S22 TaxID=3137182 RepID=UPI0035306F63